MLGAGAVCAGLAVSLVDRYANDVRAQVGAPVPVVVAARDIPRGRLLTPALASATLVQRQVPRRFAPPEALQARADAVGLETASALSAGDYVGGHQLQSPRAARRIAPASRAVRLVEIEVAGARKVAEVLRPGTVVDVLITTDRGRRPRTFLALQRVSVAGFEPSGSATVGDVSDAGDGRVTLRATLRQAVLLTAADNFAREVRVVPRAPGDDRRLRPVSVPAGLGS